MIYETYSVGGELYHARSHKYIDKIKTKSGKWRYIYKNTLDYAKNKKALSNLQDDRDYFRDLADRSYQREKDNNFYARLQQQNINFYKRHADRNSRYVKDIENRRRNYYNDAGSNYEKASKAHNINEYIDNLHEGNKKMRRANEYLLSSSPYESYHKDAANQYNKKVNAFREKLDSYRESASRNKRLKEYAKSRSDSSSRKMRDVQSKLDNSIQGMVKNAIKRLTKKKKR